MTPALRAAGKTAVRPEGEDPLLCGQSRKGSAGLRGNLVSEFVEIKNFAFRVYVSLCYHTVCSLQ